MRLRRMVLSFLVTGLLFILGEGTSVGYARWSLWSSWSPCTHTCGGGITSRTRTCQPGYSKAHDGSRCSGIFTQHGLCNKQRCATGSDNSATAQCSQYNNKVIFGHRVKRWLPDNKNKKNPCELRCRSEDSSLVYSFGKMVNGTSCMTDAVCFRGRCTKVGCDDILGSRTTKDMCANCGGRNLTCVQIQQMYSAPAGTFHDFSPITVIPAGATNIRVHEHTNNFLALLEGSPPAESSNNIRFSPRGHREFKLGGTVFTYHMAPDHNESLFALGPTSAPITLMTFTTESGSQKVLYEYWIPKATTAEPAPSSRRPTSRTVRSHLLEEGTPHFVRDDPQGTPDNRIPRPAKSSTLSVPQLKKPQKIRKKPRKPKPGSCPKCVRVGKQLMHYCNSDLAAHIRVLSMEAMERGEVRYDVAVLESFRNVFALQQREFLWSPNNTCPCPKLVVGDEYVVMGHLEQNYRRKESRLVADGKSFVRRFSEKRRRQLRRLRRRRNEKCNRTL